MVKNIIRDVTFFGKGIGSGYSIRMNKLIGTPEEDMQFQKELDKAFKEHLKVLPKI